MRAIFTQFVKVSVKSYGIDLGVNFYTRLTKNTVLGNNVNFNGTIIRGNGNVIIGDNFHSGKDILMINSYHKYEDANAIPYDTKESINKDIIIEDNVWIGDRAIILGGVTLGEGCIIQAGAVVTKSIEPFGIAGGNPAKVFKFRNKEDYLQHKANNRVC